MSITSLAVRTTVHFYQPKKLGISRQIIGSGKKR